MVGGKMHRSIQIDGAGLDIDPREFFKVWLKRSDRDVLKHQGDVCLEWVGQDRTIRVNQPGFIQLYSHLNRQGLFERDPHVAGVEGQGSPLDMSRSRQGAILKIDRMLL